jgi:hypothetical protein
MNQVNNKPLVIASISAGRSEINQLAVELTDDSLSDVGLYKGSIVIVEIDPTPYFDRLCAVVTDEGVKIRYILRANGKYWLCPKNPKYAIEETPSVEVLGYVHAYPEDVYPPTREPVTEKVTASKPSWRNRPMVLKARGGIRPS